MRRYRVVIMLVLFGVLPVVAVFSLSLRFLGESEPAQAEVEPVVEVAPQPEPPETRRVLVAARTLPVGTLLGEDDLTELEIDPEAVESEFVLAPGEATHSPLRGYVVREALAAGMPLTRQSVVGPGQRGFLAAVLEPDTRAVTIQVGPATSHAGLIDPGDRIDVILSVGLAVDGRERSLFATTIVEDVRVVAIDRTVGSSAELPAGDVEGEAAVERAKVTTVTLEVTPAQGERLVLGEQEGSLSLAVRSLATAVAGNSGGASRDGATELTEMLLSPAELSQSEVRLRRERRLNDLTLRMQIAASEQELRAAMEAGARTQDTVRIFRGSEPAEQVVFAGP